MLWDETEREVCCRINDVASSSSCWIQLCNVPVYAAYLCNMDIGRNPYEYQITTYTEAIQRDTEYRLAEVDEAFTFEYLGLVCSIILGLILLVFLYRRCCFGSRPFEEFDGMSRVELEARVEKLK